MFWDRFIKVCNDKGTTPTAVVSALKLSGGSVTKWKNGATPQDVTILKLAEYLGVSADYLQGKSNETPSFADIQTLSEQEKTLIRVFRETTEDGRLEMIAAIINIRNAIEKKNTPANTNSAG